jgi:Pyridoxamine 5'-phosphate oxidase
VRVPDDDLSMPEVAARLAAARSYRLCTTMPSGAPHAAPVWGVVLNYTLYLYSERRTVKARNLAADPRVVVHLQSAEDVLIVRGAAEDLGTPAQVPEVVAALAAKYTRPGCHCSSCDLDWRHRRGRLVELAPRLERPRRGRVLRRRWVS